MSSFRPSRFIRSISRRSSSRRQALRATLALGLLAVPLSAAAPAGAVGTCTPAGKPTIMPVADVHQGMNGHGLTVFKGKTPSSFNVHILGKVPDGILPGVPLILAKLSGPGIAAANGIVEGMSGSPVYVSGKLVGSTSYGFFPSNDIAGITPAESMVKLFDYALAPAPAGTDRPSPARLAAYRASSIPDSVSITSELRRRVARAEGVAASAVPSTGSALRTPLAVSGSNRHGMALLRKLLRKANAPFHAYSAGASPKATTISPIPLVAGDSFAASISYGDVSFAGIGTTTATCGDLAVAFGHPFFYFPPGNVHLGMNNANVLTIIPNDVVPGFKFARVAELHGVVDQDRLVGIRGQQGVAPDVVPVKSDVTNPDLGNSRLGRSGIVYDQYIPFVSAIHLLVNEDVTADRIGNGTVTLSWRAGGTDFNGQHWGFLRRNMYYSDYDASGESIFEMYGNLTGILNNKFTDVKFAHIDLQASITQDRLTSNIQKVLTKSSAQPTFKERKTLLVNPGDTVEARVFLKPYGQTTPRKVDLTVHVPSSMSRRTPLFFRGGRTPYCGFYSSPECSAGSFPDYLKVLARGEHNFDLIAELGRRGSKTSAGQKAVAAQPDIVTGSRIVELKLA